ncbi:MAG: hypothetical protein ACT4P1_07885 [Sporichthyaceae bacterium]
MPHSTGSSRAIGWLATAMAALTAAGATAIVWMPSAGAETDDFYEARARSVFVDGFFANGSIPAGVRPEGGGPQTDAAQSSLDQGDANASFPYFGDLVPTLPGVLGGLFGVPVPPYPLTATSTFGAGPAKVSYPGIELTATSRATSTVSDAVVGSSGSGATAHSEIDENSDGSVVALASTSSPLTVLGPLVSLKGFDSVVRVSADATGAITRQANFSVDEISVPGLVLRIPEQSPSSIPVPVPVPIPGAPAPPPIPAPPIPFPMGGETITEPKIGFINGFFTISLPFAGETQKYALPAEPVMDAFKAQGVSLNFTAAQKTKTGLLGGVLTVQYTVPAPPDNPIYQGPTPATFILGSADASVDRKAATSNAIVPAVATELAEFLPADPAPVIGTAVAPVVPDAVAPAPALAPVPAPAAIPTVDLVPAAPSQSGEVAALVAAGLPAFVNSDFSAIYLGLIGVALVGLVTVAVVGIKGVSA